MKRFSFDTALSADPLVLQHVIGLAGSERVLFGTDYPFLPAPIVQLERSDLDAITEHAVPDLLAALVTNGVRLLDGSEESRRSEPSEPVVLSRVDRLMLRVVRRMLGR